MHYITQAANAVTARREAEGYRFVVSDVFLIDNVATISIPEVVVAYTVVTRCTEHKKPCIWSDLVFFCGDRAVVKLMWELPREAALYGLQLEEYLPAYLLALVREYYPPCVYTEQERICNQPATIAIAQGKHALYLCSRHAGMYAVEKVG